MMSLPASGSWGRSRYMACAAACRASASAAASPAACTPTAGWGGSRAAAASWAALSSASVREEVLRSDHSCPCCCGCSCCWVATGDSPPVTGAASTGSSCSCTANRRRGASAEALPREARSVVYMPPPENNKTATRTHGMPEPLLEPRRRLGPRFPSDGPWVGNMGVARSSSRRRPCRRTFLLLTYSFYQKSAGSLVVHAGAAPPARGSSCNGSSLGPIH